MAHDDTGRVPGTPYFTSSVVGPKTIKRHEEFSLRVRFTYHGVTGADGSPEQSGARPVTFHTSNLKDGVYNSNVQATWRRGGAAGDGEEWGLDHKDGCMVGVNFDGPDVEVRVGQSNAYFHGLQPGKMCRKTVWVNGPDAGEEGEDLALPEHAVAGDVLRFRVAQVEVDWWDWGSMDDHRETAVKLPSWIDGDVTQPKFNEGRPRLVVPASEWFEIALVE